MGKFKMNAHCVTIPYPNFYLSYFKGARAKLACHLKLL